MIRYISLWVKRTLKLPSLFQKRSTKALKCIHCILMCHSTSLLSYFIILDKNKFLISNEFSRNCQCRWPVPGVSSFLAKKLQNGTQDPTNVHFLYINKCEKWWSWMTLRITNAFILCDLFWKILKNHRTNTEGSFNKHKHHDLHRRHSHK